MRDTFNSVTKRSKSRMRENSQIIKFCSLVLACTLAFSCVRQTLEDPEYLLASIPVSIDWSESNVPESSIENVSVYFYPRTGEAPVVEISSNIYYLVAELPVGEYDVVVFNEIKNNIAGMTFSSEYDLEEFSIVAVDKTSSMGSTMLYSLEAGDYVMDFPDPVGSWGSSESVVVTTDMINYTRGEEYSQYLAALMLLSQDPEAFFAQLGSTTRSSSIFSEDATRAFEQLSMITPQPTTISCSVTLKVINLSNAQRIEAVINGLTDEVTLYERATQPLVEGVQPLFVFDFVTQDYDIGSNTDGTVSETILTFGRQPTNDGVYTISFKAVLSDGSSLTIERDVSDQINSNDGLEIDIDLTSDEDMMVLPEGTASGFGVTDWGEAENVEIK